MTASPLSALRAGADGLCALEAATGLVIAYGSWLIREDFARFIHHGAGTAAIDWAAAMTALDEGSLLARVFGCSGGRQTARTASPTTKTLITE